MSISDLIAELVEEELAETSTSAGVPGYQTPNAFSTKSSKKRKRKKNKDESGYTVVNEEIDSKDYKALAQIIRMELASVFYDFYKKKSIWT